MKAFCFAVVAIFGVVSGELICLSSTRSDGTVKCGANDRYCSALSISNAIFNGGTLPMNFQGCSQDLYNTYRIKCPKNGDWNINENGAVGMIQGELICCDSDKCNSAATYSIFTVTVFIAVVTCLLSF